MASGVVASAVALESGLQSYIPGAVQDSVTPRHTVQTGGRGGWGGEKRLP